MYVYIYTYIHSTCTYIVHVHTQILFGYIYIYDMGTSEYWVPQIPIVFFLIMFAMDDLLRVPHFQTNPYCGSILNLLRSALGHLRSFREVLFELRLGMRFWPPFSRHRAMENSPFISIYHVYSSIDSYFLMYLFKNSDVPVRKVLVYQGLGILGQEVHMNPVG